MGVVWNGIYAILLMPEPLRCLVILLLLLVVVMVHLMVHTPSSNRVRRGSSYRFFKVSLWITVHTLTNSNNTSNCITNPAVIFNSARGGSGKKSRPEGRLSLKQKPLN